MADRRSVRLLIIDRAPSDATTLSSMLARDDLWDFRITIATEAEAIDELDSRSAFDVAFIGGSGSDDQLVRNVRSFAAATANAVPIVAGADEIDPSMAEQLARAGAVAVIQKSEWTAAGTSAVIGYASMSGRMRQRMASDPLTGLPTRVTWTDRMQHVIDRASRSGRPSAVLLIDIDNFKRVNDTLGHDGGDRYLVEFARRLKSVVRSQDTVARLGGDEFAILVEELPYPEIAMQIAAKVINVASEPIKIDITTMEVSVSVGVAILSPDARYLSVDWAQRAADVALYESKHLGKNRYSLFTDDMDRSLVEAIKFDDEIVLAVERNEFTLHYQPIVNLRHGELDGFEALLRWKSGRHPNVSPAVFVPTLERIGLMDRVGQAVFREAINRAAIWHRTTGRTLAMHINLSPAQLVNRHFSKSVLELLDETGFPPEGLVIELTESMLFEQSDLVERGFKELRSCGVKIGIDDFGTGYNSLVNLKQFAPDLVKVDRGFVAQLTSSPVDEAIVRAQAVLVETLGITGVAEGVETDDHLVSLQRIGGIEQAQGYLLGRPMSAATIESDYRPFQLLCRTKPEGGLPGPAMPRGRPTEETERLITRAADGRAPVA